MQTAKITFEYEHEVLVYNSASLAFLIDELQSRRIGYLIGLYPDCEAHVVLIDKEVKLDSLTSIPGIDQEGDDKHMYLVYDAFKRTTIIRTYAVSLDYFNKHCPEVKVTETKHVSGEYTFYRYMLEWPANNTLAHKMVKYIVDDLHQLI